MKKNKKVVYIKRLTDKEKAIICAIIAYSILLSNLLGMDLIPKRLVLPEACAWTLGCLYWGIIKSRKRKDSKNDAICRKL